MTIQVIDLMRNYITGEVIARVEMKTHLSIPKIMIKSFPNTLEIESFLTSFYPEIEKHLSY